MSPMTQRVLLVDDEPALLGALRRVVERTFPDAIVVYASDARTAIWQLDTTAIRVVVTDLRMGGDPRAGWTVVKAAMDAGIPVAVLTSCDDAEAIKEVGVPVPVLSKASMNSEGLLAIVEKAFAEARPQSSRSRIVLVPGVAA